MESNNTFDAVSNAMIGFGRFQQPGDFDNCCYRKQMRKYENIS
jgi:hypothetical protein